ncbi:MAG TPA: TldD/PmbA family protein [Thermoplasmata archaeon]|nr:TldD/PmbA family protein [Thermoplasmata archaeon]
MSSADTGAAATAFRVADRLRPKAQGPWEVFGERIQRFEIHFTGGSIEMVRGPIQAEGYGVRTFAPHNGGMGVGFAASSDLSGEGVDGAHALAMAVGKHSQFPAKKVDLPTRSAGSPVDLQIVDRALWERPIDTLESFASELIAATSTTPHIVPSFGSVRATLAEATIANSAGATAAYSHSFVDLEIAVKASGGAEGPAPGEWWVNARFNQLPRDYAKTEAPGWLRRAEDVRHAEPTPGGHTRVLFPPDVLDGIVPVPLGFRLSGSAALRKMTPKVGTEVAPALLSIHDDGLLPRALGSAPVDDEGSPQRRGTLIDQGKTAETICDLLHGEAIGTGTSGNARREPPGFLAEMRFTNAPVPGPTTMVVSPGTGGTDEEMIEAAGDGIWLDQLGWAFPDPISTAFGGEIRLGYRIRRGRREEAVRGGTLGGILLTPEGSPSFLRSISAIGSKPLIVGTMSTPTWQVDDVEVAGD